MNMSNGQLPRRVVTSGFSLGGGLSELCAVWAAILWPTADILVANQVRAGCRRWVGGRWWQAACAAAAGGSEG